MTSTPVADVSSYLANYTSARAAGSGVDTANSFNDVLKQQTGRTENAGSPAARTKTDRAAHERLSSKETSVKTEKGSSLKEKTEMPEEEISRTVEEAAAQILVMTARELNLTVEEVEGLLEELHMEAADLLNPDNIPVLVLKAAGSADRMELITDQELYATVQSLTEEIQSMKENLTQETGLSQEELAQVFKELAGRTDESEQIAQNMSDEEVPLLREDEKQAQPGENVNDEKTVSEEQTPKITVTRKHMPEKGQENAKQESNPFAQQLNVANETGRTVSVLSAGETFTTGSSSQIMNQIMDYMNVSLQPDMTELTMQLHPESLGKVNVHISAKEGVITAQFTAQNETVKAVLESQMIQLKENFTQQGIKVEAVEVTVENHGFERSMDQGGQTGSGEQEGKRSRTRRLQADMFQDMEIEDLSEEEQLAVRMMEQNGNTVDYTA